MIHTLIKNNIFLSSFVSSKNCLRHFFSNESSVYSDKNLIFYNNNYYVLIMNNIVYSDKNLTLFAFLYNLCNLKKSKYDDTNINVLHLLF